MTPDRLRQIASVWEMAADLDIETRNLYLASLEAQDPELVAQVRSHLEEQPSGSDFLDLEPTAPLAVKPSDPSSLPTHVGSYRLQEWLGAGGMATVYAAKRDDDEFHRRVAVKILHTPFPSEELIRRFRGERQILADFDHPNIAKLYEGSTTENGLPYLVMELIERTSLPAHCDERRLGVRRRIEVFRKVCAAVQYAHARLVVHRDLKPSNIMMDEQGEPKLLDFGIAKLLAPEAFPLTVQATMTGQGLFTPHYASPEQLRGDAITIASDVYSLGVNLYLLLSGMLPYRPQHSFPTAFLELMKTSTPTLVSRAVYEGKTQHGTGTIERFGVEEEVLSRQLSGDLDNIVAKALETEPERRYGSVEQFDDDLRRYLEGEPVSAREGTWLYRAGKMMRRHKLETGGLAGFLGMSSAFSIAMRRQNRRIAEEKEVADAARRKAETAAVAEKQVSQLLLDLFAEEDPERLRSRGSKIQLAREAAEKVSLQVDLDSTTRIRLLSTLGLLLRNLSALDSAIFFLEEAEELSRGQKSQERLEILINLARSYFSAGKLTAADELLIQCESLAESADDRRSLATIKNLQGIIAYNRGRIQSAFLSCQTSQRISEELFGTGSPESMQARLNAIGFDFDLGEQKRSLEEYLLIAEEHLNRVSATSATVLRCLFNGLSEARFARETSCAVGYSINHSLALYGIRHSRFLEFYTAGVMVLTGLGAYATAQSMLASLPLETLPQERFPRIYDDLIYAQAFLAMARNDPQSTYSLLSHQAGPDETVLARRSFASSFLKIWSAIETGEDGGFEAMLKQMEDFQDPTGVTRSLWLALNGRIEEKLCRFNEAISFYKASLEEIDSKFLDLEIQWIGTRLQNLLKSQGHHHQAQDVADLMKRAQTPTFEMTFPDWLYDPPPWPTREDMLATIYRLDD